MRAGRNEKGGRKITKKKGVQREISNKRGHLGEKKESLSFRRISKNRGRSSPRRKETSSYGSS